MTVEHSLSLTELVAQTAPEELAELVADFPPDVVSALLAEFGADPDSLPATPMEQATLLDENYRERDHLRYVSKRIASAVEDVENGTSRRLIIEMPPRTGKTYLATQITSLWALRRHPDWQIALTSHDGTLAAQWGRQVRRWIENGKAEGIGVAKDAGAVKEWETTEGGGVLSRSVRESLTGRGARVLVIDDPHKDFVDAHSATFRDAIWDWWLSVAQTRLEPPSLVVAIQTRWHEDDLVGRLLSKEYEGDPAAWERIRLPALADTENDPIGRELGEPLLSPLFTETREQAVERWAETRTAVGEYVWSALYQQSPSPAKGAIFDMGAWRFWTTDPALATRDDDGELDPDGKTILLDPLTGLSGARWLDSWDMAFKDTKNSDYVVGQRWAKLGERRFLVAQSRGRRSFTNTIAEVRAWVKGTAGSDIVDDTARHVHQRLVEDKANGTAIINALRDEVAGIKPINPRDGKEARARSITPEIESGHFYLPHPSEPGHAWVKDLLSELRNFPHDAHDDQVDALTQAATELRSTGKAGVTVPGGRNASPGQQTIKRGYASGQIGRRR